MREFIDVFGNLIGTVITVVFGAGFLWKGISARFDALETKVDTASKQNDREHQEFKGDINDHELRLRQQEWRR